MAYTPLKRSAKTDAAAPPSYTRIWNRTLPPLPTEDLLPSAAGMHEQDHGNRGEAMSSPEEDFVEILDCQNSGGTRLPSVKFTRASPPLSRQALRAHSHYSGQAPPHQTGQALKALPDHSGPAPRACSRHTRQAPPHHSGQAPMALPHHSGQAPRAPDHTGQAPPHHTGQASPHHSGQAPRAPPHHSGQAPRASPHHSGQASPHHSGQAPRAPLHHSGQAPRASPHHTGQASRADGYHNLQKQDNKHSSFNPMYGGDLPPGIRHPPDGEGQHVHRDDGETVPKTPARSTCGTQPAAASIHVYDNEKPGDGSTVRQPPDRGGLSARPVCQRPGERRTTDGAQPVYDNEKPGSTVGQPPNRARPLPSIPRPGGRRTNDGAQPVAATTHVYEDGDTFGQCLGPPLNRDALGAPPVPSTPRPGRRTTDGDQPVAGATHLYEDGDSFGQCLGPPLNRDALGAPPIPSTPRPGRRDDQMGSQNQPPDAAGERCSIWEQVCQGRRGTAIIILASVVMVTLTLLVLVHVLLVHTTSLPLHPDSPTTDTGGSSVVLRTVTSADVIMINPVPERGSPEAVTAQVETGGHEEASRPPSTDTKEVSLGSSSAHSITFGGESGDGSLSYASGVAVSSDNKIWVADQNKARLQVYSMEGVHLYQFQPDAPGLGYPSKVPSAVSIDRDGHLWVLMIGYPARPDSVVQFSLDGHLKANFDLPDTVPRGAVRGMAVDLRNDHILVTWSGLFCGGMQAFNPGGKLLWDVGPARMKTPMYIAVDQKGNSFVSDHGTHFVYKYDKTGQYVSRFGGAGMSGANLNRPGGICVDRSGHIVVVDSDNQRLVVYTSQGKYVRHIALRITHPNLVAVGPRGELVVMNKNTIVVFTRY